MRNLLTTISTIVRQDNQLIVRGEVLRSFCANSFDALVVMCGVKPAPCFAVVKQTTRRHAIACHRASA